MGTGVSCFCLLGNVQAKGERGWGESASFAAFQPFHHDAAFCAAFQQKICCTLLFTAKCSLKKRFLYIVVSKNSQPALIAVCTRQVGICILNPCTSACWCDIGETFSPLSIAIYSPPSPPQKCVQNPSSTCPVQNAPERDSVW